MTNSLTALLTMAETLCAEGDAVSDDTRRRNEESHRRCMAHVRQIEEFEALVNEVRNIILQEKQRFGRYFSKPEEPQKLRATSTQDSLTEQLRQAANDRP